MPCTPYPATFPCDLAPPVHVNPYLPTPPATSLPTSDAWVSRIEDELDMAQPVPEPALGVLLSIAYMAIFARKKTP